MSSVWTLEVRDEVHGVLAQYLSLLSSEGPQEWVWRELKAITEMKFMFQAGSGSV